MFSLVPALNNKHILKNTGEKNLWYGKFSIFPENKVTHAVSTKFGGFSNKFFQSLNLALHVGDEPENVIANRKKFFKNLNLNLNHVTTCRQVHGCNVVCVDTENIGAGAYNLDNTIENADALITNLKNIPLTLFFADCTPIMIYDPVKHAIGIAHGGWRGTVGKIALLTVEKMNKVFGTNPKDCLSSIGPSIGQCCYEIGDEVAEKFIDVFTDKKDLILQYNSFSHKYHLDLWQANAIMLQKAGLKKENIDIANICTCCNSDIFFSYRADKGQTGRIAAVISLK